VWVEFLWEKVLEFVWEGGRICVGKMVGVSIFVWGRWSIFVGEGARICVRGRWSGGLNLCAGKVDRRRADGHVRSWASLCEVARLSAAWHTFRQSISADALFPAKRPYSVDLVRDLCAYVWGDKVQRSTE